MGVAAHQPAVFSQWLNRREVLVGTVKAGRMAWRNSFRKVDADAPNAEPRRTNGLWGESLLMAGGEAYRIAAAAFDPTASAARCKMSSRIRDVPGREPDGRDTFRPRPAHGSNVMDKGETANPTGMVQRIGY